MHALPWDPDGAATKTDVALLEQRIETLEHKLSAAIDRAIAGQTRVFIGTTITLVLAMVGTVVGVT